MSSVFRGNLKTHKKWRGWRRWGWWRSRRPLYDIS